jgi:probable blue pigment (indigoidine) exporter
VWPEPRNPLAVVLALRYYGLVLNDRSVLLAATAAAPVAWGSTYLVTTELLPPGRPLLAAAVRALPAGILLVALTRQLPHGSWWWRAGVLGVLNIGAFFALLFVAAYRLPGGIAAVVGAVQPLLVAVLASRLLCERLTARRLLAAGTGFAGVAVLVLRADAHLDGIGIAAALGGALAMSLGVVLTKRWGRPAPLLTMTGWQLTAGGLFLAPLALLVEGPPPANLSGGAVAGFAYLTIVGTAVAYALWFRGLQALPATDVALLGLLSPLVATALGWIVAGQSLSGTQAVGGLLVLVALLVLQGGRTDPAAGTRRARPPGAGRIAAKPARDRAGGSTPERAAHRLLPTPPSPQGSSS